MRGGSALLTEDEWKSCNITAKDCADYPNPKKQQDNGTPEFKAKLQKAHQIFGDKYQKLRGFSPVSGSPTVVDGHFLAEVRARACTVTLPAPAPAITPVAPIPVQPSATPTVTPNA